MKNLLTKKKVLLLGLLGTLIIMVVTFLAMSGFCYHNETCLGFFRKHHPWSAVNYILFTPPLFLFSLLTYKMRKEIFTAWINFAKWWIPLTILLTLIAPASDGSFLPVTKGSVAFVMTGLFTALSFCIIVAMWVRKEKK